MDTSFRALGHNVSISPVAGAMPLLSSGPAQGPIGKREIGRATELLQKYKQGKANLEKRIVENERWYKLRHWEVVRGKSGKAEDVEPASAWLFNSLANKHADAMDNYPEPSILPRESSDEPDAKTLSSVIPVIIERNEFEETYSDAWWYKLKFGTAVYGSFWDSELENGLGDVAIKKIDLLNTFWQPGITDIQQSRNLFIVQLVDDEVLLAQYPHIKSGHNTTVSVQEYIYDDNVDTTDKSVVVDWYYKKAQTDPATGALTGKKVLHYVKFVGNELLYASENDPSYSATGWYGHGRYPVVFDVLFPEEGTPVGFGYIDVMREPQLYIDKLNQIILKNALMAGKRRFFIKDTGGVNEAEFADWSKDFVHVAGGLEEQNIREINVSPLDGFIVNHLQMKIDELKETSGNRDFGQGGTSGGVTAAAAIAALQEAGNKLSRDMIKGSYRAYTRIIYLCIELIRQFYDEERAFRIEGPQGVLDFIQYSNARIKEQEIMPPYPGGEPAYRVPVFDIRVKAQKTNPFSRAAQNELAKELYGAGFFNPALADQALAALELMDFEGIQKVRERISQNGGMYRQLMVMQQTMARMAQALGLDMGEEQGSGGGAGGAGVGAPGSHSGMAQTAGRAVQNANTSYGERLAARATPDVGRQAGVRA